MRIVFVDQIAAIHPSKTRLFDKIKLSTLFVITGKLRQIESSFVVIDVTLCLVAAAVIFLEDPPGGGFSAGSPLQL